MTRRALDSHAIDVVGRLLADLRSGALCALRIEMIDDASKIGLSVEAVAAGDKPSRFHDSASDKTGSGSCPACDSFDIGTTESNDGVRAFCRECGAFLEG